MQLNALLGLAFAAAPPVIGLASLHPVTRRLIKQKARGQAVAGCPSNCPSTACKRTVSGTISLPSLGCFSPFPHGTSSLSVASKYLALEDGPPRFPRDFTCPAVLGYCFQEDNFVSPTGLSPSLVALSRDLPLRNCFLTSLGCPTKQPHNPDHGLDGRFGLFPFRSPLLGESQLISVPKGTEMFHFPSSASNTYSFGARWCCITNTGFPHSEIPGSKPA